MTATTMRTYEHAGVKIECIAYETSVVFQASVSGTTKRFPSLAAAKKAIDAARAVNFKPFDAIQVYDNKLVKVRVIGLEADRGSYRFTGISELSNGERTLYEVTPDTTE